MKEEKRKMQKTIEGDEEKRSMRILMEGNGSRKMKKKKKNKSVVLVRKRIKPIERSPPVSEASANFSG
jgi:hypothetical protein